MEQDWVIYMSKKIIEEHCGGLLSVSNAAEDAVFHMGLPYALASVQKEDS